MEIIGISEISWQDKDLDDERTDLYIYYLRKQGQTQHYDQHNILSRYKALMTNIAGICGHVAFLLGDFVFSIDLYLAVQPSEVNVCVPFETKIPKDCISSCSFEFGFVQYELKVSCKTVCGVKEYKENLKIIKLTSSDQLSVSEHPTQQSCWNVTAE